MQSFESRERAGRKEPCATCGTLIINTAEGGLIDADSRARHRCAVQSALIEQNPSRAATAPEAAATDAARPRDDRSSVATALVNLALEELRVDLFHSPDQTPYVSLTGERGIRTYRVDSSGFQKVLSSEFFKKEQRAAPSQAVTEAIHNLSARAQFEGLTRDVYVRVARLEGCVYVDLADDDGTVVEITPKGWSLTSEPPVRFERPAGQLPLPEPSPDGGPDHLWPFVNVEDDSQKLLFFTAMVASLTGIGPFPIVHLSGEQGSAKSTTERVFQRAVDPNRAGLRGQPKNDQDLAIAASNSWLLAYDNLSDMKPWLSDALCRVSTGAGFATRALYTDREEALFSAMRPIIVNGIGNFATRSDFLDRALGFSCPRIRSTQRRSEDEFWSDFNEALPLILGALFDGVAAVLRELPNVRLESSPRMADFARVGAALADSIGWSADAFLAAYETNRVVAAAVVLEDSPLTDSILRFAEEEGVDGWRGTATELFDALSHAADDHDIRRPGWPKNAAALGTALRLLAPSLRDAGLELEFLRSGDRRAISIRTLSHQTENPADEAVIPVTAVTDSRNRGLVDDGYDSDDGDAVRLYECPNCRRLLSAEPLPLQCSFCGWEDTWD